MLALIAVLAACSARPAPTPVVPARCRVGGYVKIPQRYPVHNPKLSLAGIAVDAAGQVVDLDDLDGRARAVAACLDVKIDPGCIVVRIAEDSVPSCSSKDYRLLPIEAPGEGCARKPWATPETEACPCRLRGGIQEDRAIVVTPDLYVLGDVLVQAWTGTSDPWRSGERNQRCALAGSGTPAEWRRRWTEAHGGAPKP